MNTVIVKMKIGIENSRQDEKRDHSHKWEFENGLWSCDCGEYMARLPRDRIIEGIIQGTKTEVTHFLRFLDRRK